MLIIIKYLLMFFLILSAAMAVIFNEELISIIFLSIFSIILTTLYVIYQAPDVALAEAVIGAGLNTAIFMTTISHIRADDPCHLREDD